MLRNEWLAHLDGLVVFRGLLAAEPLCTLRAALAADDAALTGAVAAFEAALFARGTNWTDALLEAVLEDENLCLKVAAGQEAGPVLEKAMDDELDFLQALGRAPLDEVFPDAAAFLPRWQVTPDARLPRGLRSPPCGHGPEGLRYVCPPPCLCAGRGSPGAGALPRPAAFERAARLRAGAGEGHRQHPRPAGRPPRQ